MRGATRSLLVAISSSYISIHAPRAGSDGQGRQLQIDSADFNPRSPCGERLKNGIKSYASTNFNPRSPCGERRKGAFTHNRPVEFQSTLPVRGATVGTDCLGYRHKKFQSTLPVRGATRNLSNQLANCCCISIHAPRAGSDDENMKEATMYA